MGAFYPPKSATPINCILCVGGSHALQMIGVRSVMIGPMSVADYVGKLSLQHERLTKSSSSFSSFSPLMPGQLPSPADSRVVTMSASPSAVCAITYAVADPTVTAATVVSTPSVTPVEPSCKRRRVTDPKERELMMLHFEDWWASGTSTPRPDPSSSSQLHLITPPLVVPALIPSAVPVAVAGTSAAAVLASLQSAASSSRSCQSPRPCPAPAQPTVSSHPGPIPSPSPGPVTPLGAVSIHGTHLPPSPGPVTRLGTVPPVHGIDLPPLPVAVPVFHTLQAHRPRLPTARCHRLHHLTAQLL